MVSAPSPARRLLTCWTAVEGSSIIIALRRARSGGHGSAALTT